MTKDAERMPLEHYITKVSGPLHNQAAQVESRVEYMIFRFGTTLSSGIVWLLKGKLYLKVL